MPYRVQGEVQGPSDATYNEIIMSSATLPYFVRNGLSLKTINLETLIGARYKGTNGVDLLYKRASLVSLW